jgi:hypothetical protein
MEPIQITVSVVEMVCIVVSLVVMGGIAGHQFLPPRINTEREALIDKLFQENMLLRFGGVKEKSRKQA